MPYKVPVTVQKVCIEPGCEKPRYRTNRRCLEHRGERAYARLIERRAGRVGVTCLICGEGPFVQVGVHSAKKHGVTSPEYRRRFPGADMTHPDLKAAFRLEGEEKGFGEPGRRRKRRCRRGHLLAGKNVITSPNRKLRIRACRKCVNERYRQRRRERSAASGTKLCECGCGTEIPRISSRGTPQRFVVGHNRRSVSA